MDHHGLIQSCCEINFCQNIPSSARITWSFHRQQHQGHLRWDAIRIRQHRKAACMAWASGEAHLGIVGSAPGSHQHPQLEDFGGTSDRKGKNISIQLVDQRRLATFSAETTLAHEREEASNQGREQGILKGCWYCESLKDVFNIAHPFCRQVLGI